MLALEEKWVDHQNHLEIFAFCTNVITIRETEV